MAAAEVTAILSLTVLLPAAAFPCRTPHLQRPDNTTASKLLGTWLYVAGAAQFPRHLLEMLLIDHGHLRVEPHAGKRELLITQRVAVGDQCLTNNSTYFEITTSNTTLVKHAKTQQTVGTLMNLSSEDLLLIQYQLQRDRTYSGLYLYARNLSVSTAHREEFEHHAKRLGLSEEEIVYAPWKTIGVRFSGTPRCCVMSGFRAWLAVNGAQEGCSSQSSSRPGTGMSSSLWAGVRP